MTTETEATTNAPADAPKPKPRQRKRRNSLPQVEIKPDAEKAVEQVNSQQPSPIEVSPPNPAPLKEISQQDLARLYSPAALLNKGAWVRPVPESHSQAHMAELAAQFKAIEAQQALTKHELAMARRQSSELIHKHTCEHSTRYTVRGPSESELEAKLEALTKQSEAIESAFLAFNENKAGAQVNGWRNQSAIDTFMQTIAANDLKAITDMLESGFDVNCRDDRGWTPLHQSCYMGDHHIAITQLLLNRGAEVASVTADGRTALQLAQRLCNVRTSQLLSARGTGRAPESLLSPGSIISPPPAGLRSSLAHHQLVL